MRNLKRVLSLTLASVMLLGMMVIGSSAAAQGYDDVDETHNVEAIEVLQAVGVMVGDGDGNLRPDADVSRGEMAVIMAKLMDLDYEYYSAAGVHPFNDMVGHYAEAYVAACKANGIIAGRTDTTYDPNAGVTAIEAASMMMRALGYFKYSSDYAAGFEVATVTQGTKINIFDGVGSNASTPMTRNQVAQLALNTLKSGMVEPESTTSITTPDGFTISTSNVAYHYISSNDPKYNTAIGSLSPSDYGQAGGIGPIVELGEQLYKGDLKLIPTSDAFGRHSNQWTYKNTEIGLYARDLIASYTGEVKNGALYTLVGSLVRSNYDLAVYVNGRDVVARGPIANDTYIANRSTANNTIPDTGKGILTEVYMNETDELVTIVQTYTYVAKVLTDYEESRDAVNIEVINIDEATPYSSNGSAPTTYATIIANVSGILEGEDFPEIADLHEGDYILFTYSESGGANGVGNDQIEEICLAEVVTGEVSSVTDADDSTGGSRLKEVVIGGTPYGYNAVYNSRGVAVDKYELGVDATVVLDTYGNIIYDAEAIAANNNFLYVDGMVRSTGFSNRASANVYFADGTNEIITVSDITVKYGPGINNTATGATNEALDGVTAAAIDGGETAVNTTTGKVSIKDLSGTLSDFSSVYGALDTAYTAYDLNSTQFDGWYSYVKNSDGTYKLTELYHADIGTAPNDHYKQVAYQRFDGTAGEVSISGGAARYYTAGTDWSGTTNFSANSSTTFIVVKDDKIYVYEGAQNLPDITLNTGSGDDAIITAARGDKASGVASVVLIIDDDMTIKGKQTEDLLYVINSDSSYKEDGKIDGDTIYVYNAILNGVKTKIETKDNLTTLGLTNSGFRSWTMDDGYYVLTGSSDKITDANATDEYIAGDTAITSGDIKYDDGTLTINTNWTYQVTKDTMIRVLLTQANATTNRNELLGSDSNRTMRTYTASALASLDDAYQSGGTFEYRFFGLLEDDQSKSDVLKVLYVIISEAHP